MGRPASDSTSCHETPRDSSLGPPRFCQGTRRPPRILPHPPTPNRSPASDTPSAIKSQTGLSILNLPSKMERAKIMTVKRPADRQTIHFHPGNKGFLLETAKHMMMT